MSMFHITITDNELGETIADMDTDCIIGAFDPGDDSTRSMCFTNCTGLDLLATMTAAQRVINGLKKNVPEPLLRYMDRLASKTDDDDDTDN